ncbi:MAG: hypothetical protein LC792_04135 [Actinobacteria bacterium]|nr:hypothetical protein [Actinomycetota bacterium]
MTAELRGRTFRLTVPVVATAALSGHRAVSPIAAGIVGYADYATDDDMGRPIWITTSATAAGEGTDVVAYGMITEPTWDWIPARPVYLGANGALTQAVPAAPAARFQLQVATAESPTTIYVDPKLAIGLV